MLSFTVEDEWIIKQIYKKMIKTQYVGDTTHSFS